MLRGQRLACVASAASNIALSDLVLCDEDGVVVLRPTFDITAFSRRSSIGGSRTSTFEWAQPPDRRMPARAGALRAHLERRTRRRRVEYCDPGSEALFHGSRSHDTATSACRGAAARAPRGHRYQKDTRRPGRLAGATTSRLMVGKQPFIPGRRRAEDDLRCLRGQLQHQPPTQFASVRPSGRQVERQRIPRTDPARVLTAHDSRFEDVMAISGGINGGPVRPSTAEAWPVRRARRLLPSPPALPHNSTEPLTRLTRSWSTSPRRSPFGTADPHRKSLHSSKPHLTFRRGARTQAHAFPREALSRCTTLSSTHERRPSRSSTHDDDRRCVPDAVRPPARRREPHLGLDGASCWARLDRGDEQQADSRADERGRTRCGRCCSGPPAGLRQTPLRLTARRARRRHVRHRRRRRRHQLVLDVRAYVFVSSWSSACRSRSPAADLVTMERRHEWIALVDDGRMLRVDHEAPGHPLDHLLQPGRRDPTMTDATSSSAR